MEVIKFDRVVSVSNELQGHGVQNILEGEISPSKNWMCEKGTEKAVAILQLERPALITSVHIGNAHSAFVEVLVGKAADSADQFESLIPMSVFMNLHESKTGSNPNRTRFFNRADFNEATSGKSWDRVKVVCSQPFNKHVPYGLCFLKVHGEKEARRGEASSGRATEGDEIEIGSFFRKKRSSGGDKTLTVGEPTKEGEREAKLAGATQKVKDEKPVEKKEDERREKKEEKPKRKAEEAEGTPKRRKEEKPEERKAESTSKQKKEEDKQGERNRQTNQPIQSSSKQTNKEVRPKEPDETQKRRKEEDKQGERNRQANQPIQSSSRQTNKEVRPKEPDETQKRKQKEQKERKRKKPFGKLMEDVVLVISGFQNPLRGDIRSMALQMGAKYSPDWGTGCTHLVCAYDNTPKFRQVKGKGKIVKKDWVEKCHRERRRYPWRRFALDRTDLQKPESEEEIEAGEEVDEQVPSTSSSSPVTSSQRGNSGGNEEYNAATDDEEEDVVDTTEYPMPHLPDLFARETFFVDPRLKGRAALERYIVAYNGVLKETFDEDVDFYVTNGAPVELFREKAPRLLPIKPSWIWEINSRQKRISTGPHLVK